jgi:hypothetical protein
LVEEEGGAERLIRPSWCRVQQTLLLAAGVGEAEMERKTIVVDLETDPGPEKMELQDAWARDEAEDGPLSVWTAPV